MPPLRPRRRVHGGYCCYGCELAAQIAGEGEQRRSELYGLITFCLLLSMIVMMLSLFLFAEDVYLPAPDADLAWMRRAYRVVSALLSTPVVLLLGAPLLRRSLRAPRFRWICSSWPARRRLMGSPFTT